MANKNITAKEKARRRQHRKDHATDADRQIMKDNKGDQKGRRNARRANFEAQGNDAAADFNFDQHGKGHVSGQEIRHLRKSGQSKKDTYSFLIIIEYDGCPVDACLAVVASDTRNMSSAFTCIPCWSNSSCNSVLM